MAAMPSVGLKQKLSVLGVADGGLFGLSASSRLRQGRLAVGLPRPRRRLDQRRRSSRPARAATSGGRRQRRRRLRRRRGGRRRRCRSTAADPGRPASAALHIALPGGMTAQARSRSRTPSTAPRRAPHYGRRARYARAARCWTCRSTTPRHDAPGRPPGDAPTSASDLIAEPELSWRRAALRRPGLGSTSSGRHQLVDDTAAPYGASAARSSPRQPVRDADLDDHANDAGVGLGHAADGHRRRRLRTPRSSRRSSNDDRHVQRPRRRQRRRSRRWTRSGCDVERRRRPALEVDTTGLADGTYYTLACVVYDALGNEQDLIDAKRRSRSRSQQRRPRLAHADAEHRHERRRRRRTPQPNTNPNTGGVAGAHGRSLPLAAPLVLALAEADARLQGRPGPAVRQALPLRGPPDLRDQRQAPSRRPKRTRSTPQQGRQEDRTRPARRSRDKGRFTIS